MAIIWICNGFIFSLWIKEKIMSLLGSDFSIQFIKSIFSFRMWLVKIFFLILTEEVYTPSVKRKPLTQEAAF